VILKVRIQNFDEIDNYKEQIMKFASVAAVDFVVGEYLISLKYRNEMSDIVDLFGNNVNSINTKEPTLEDVFINTVK
jgi:ABC-2 type transport system ATP-binding protein